MTYQPPRPTDPTQFPRPTGRDLDMDIRLIEEAWAVHYPLVRYRPIDKRTTPVASVDLPSGEAGSTLWDPLWGETMAPTATAWQQPHGTAGAVAATDLEVYLPEVQMNFQVIRVTAESPDIKKYGFDNDDRRLGTLIAVVPTSVLDKNGVTCQAGDLLLLEGDEWMVIKPRRAGYWENTNIPLYVNLLLERRRHGS